MKITNIFLFLLLCLGVSMSSIAQTTDFWAGKWDILLKDIPGGDATLTTNLVRKDKKLTGDLTSKDQTIPIEEISENGDKITLVFTAQGMSISLDLAKVDDNTIKGKLMDNFDAEGKRLKEEDFFAGKWEILVTGSPRGDVKFKTDLVRKEGKLTGELVSDDDKRPITKVEEKGNKISIFFNSSQGGEIAVDLEKIDDNTLKGSLMNFDASAKRIK